MCIAVCFGEELDIAVTLNEGMMKGNVGDILGRNDNVGGLDEGEGFYCACSGDNLCCGG